MATTITIQGLSKHYKSYSHGITKAVDAISLTIPAGQLFFLLGPSGCGKTTLLRMIAGFIEPTAGRVLFDGRDVTRTPPSKRNTGMVFQSYALWPHMSVAQNVAFGLSVRRVAKPEREQRVMDALKAVRMDSYAKRKPNQLSGGQQQRVALARALVVRPDVLLLDEPLSNLDAKLRLEMRSEIRRICTEGGGNASGGITTVYVTHDQKEALSMADQVAVLDMGIVAQTGTPRDLYMRPRSRFVADFLGETNFIPAEVKGRRGDALLLHSTAGDLSSTAYSPAGTPDAGGVTCSIRPEAFRIVEPGRPGAIVGRIVESIYLGEMAQYLVDLSAGEGGAGPGNAGAKPPTRVKVTELHPHAQHANRDRIALAVDPEDVVVVAD